MYTFTIVHFVANIENSALTAIRRIMVKKEIGAFHTDSFINDKQKKRDCIYTTKTQPKHLALDVHNSLVLTLPVHLIVSLLCPFFHMVWPKRSFRRIRHLVEKDFWPKWTFGRTGQLSFCCGLEKFGASSIKYVFSLTPFTHPPHRTLPSNGVTCNTLN